MPAQTVTGVHVVRHGVPEVYRADIVVVACGALSSALLMLRSASDAHPNGLANGSGLVGRNYMRHNNSAFMAVSLEPNDTVFQKTLALSDFYFGADDYEFPLGEIQMIGKSHGDQVKAEGLPAFLSFFPNRPFDELARHSLDFWVMTEDLPRRDNRIFYQGRQGHPRHGADRRRPAQAPAPQARGPARPDRRPPASAAALALSRQGRRRSAAPRIRPGRWCSATDPATSVLDLDCRAHEVDNLYCVDAGFFPSIGAVNPTLTIIANAMRVADHLKARMG